MASALPPAARCHSSFQIWLSPLDSASLPINCYCPAAPSSYPRNPCPPSAQVPISAASPLSDIRSCIPPCLSFILLWDAGLKGLWVVWAYSPDSELWTLPGWSHASPGSSGSGRTWDYSRREASVAVLGTKDIWFKSICKNGGKRLCAIACHVLA